MRDLLDPTAIDQPSRPEKVDREERARRAVVEFRRQLTGLTQTARALTGKPDLRVLLTPGTPHTDGRHIYLRPPIELGDRWQHVRVLCDRRDPLTMQQLCRACAVREGIQSTLYHEMAHNIYESFQHVDEQEHISMLRKSVRDYYRHDKELAGRVQKRIDRRMRDTSRPASFLEIASLVSPYLSTVLNGLEDGRINTRTIVERPGMKVMFHAQAKAIFEGGIHGIDGRVTLWTDQPRNAQAIIGLFCKVMGYQMNGWLLDEVVSDLDDPELDRYTESIRFMHEASEVYEVLFPIVARLKALGYLLDNTDPAPDGDSDPQPGGSGEEAMDADDADKGDDESDAESQGSGAAEADDEADDGEADDDADAEGEGGDGPSDDDADAEQAEGDGEGDGGSVGEDDDEAGGSGPDAADDDEGEGDGSSDEGDPADASDEGDPVAESAEGGDGGDDAGDAGEEADDDGARDAGEEAADGDDVLDDDGGSGGSSGSGQPYDPDGDPLAPPDLDDVRRAVDEVRGHDPDEPQNVSHDRHVPGSERAGQAPEADEDTDFEDFDDDEPPLTQGEWERAVNQVDHFDRPSDVIKGVDIIAPEDIATYHGSGKAIVRPDEAVMTPALAHLRRVFSENFKHKTERNLKRGRVNPRALGRKAPFDDPRIMQKREIPGKRSYFVLIGVDISYSNAINGTLPMVKMAVAAQADMLARIGVDFAIYAHTSTFADASGELQLKMIRVKDVHEEWTERSRDRLSGLHPQGGNFDGHVMEFYRKRMEEVRNVSDRVLMYYCDGQMPDMNYHEELAILQDELGRLRKLRVKVMGVGIRNDSPTNHGLDTVLVMGPNDIPQVVRHLEKALEK